MEVTKGAQPGNPVAPDEKLATWRAKAVFYGEAAMRFLLLERRLAHDPIRADLIRHAHLDVRRALHFAILYVEGWGTVEPMSKTRRLQRRRKLRGEVGSIGLFPLRKDAEGVPARRAAAPPPGDEAESTRTSPRRPLPPQPSAWEAIHGWGQIVDGLRLLRSGLNGDRQG